jgi:hypothetical protein
MAYIPKEPAQQFTGRMETPLLKTMAAGKFDFGFRCPIGGERAMAMTQQEARKNGAKLSGGCNRRISSTLKCSRWADERWDTSSLIARLDRER